MCAMPHVEGGLYVSGDSAGKRTRGVPSLWRRREERRKYVRNAKQCICWGIVHNRCINKKQGHSVSATSRMCSYTGSKSGRRATTKPTDNEGQQ